MSNLQEARNGTNQSSLRDKLSLKGTLKAGGTSLILSGLGVLAYAGYFTNREISNEIDSMTLPYPQAAQIMDAKPTVTAFNNQVKELALSGSETITIPSDILLAYKSLENESVQEKKYYQLFNDKNVLFTEGVGIASFFTGIVTLVEGYRTKDIRKSKITK